MSKKKINKIAEERAFDYQRELGMIDSVSDDHVVARRMGFYDGFIDGAEWQKKLDDLETADLLAIAHLQGMEQQKSKMLEDAVDGYVNYYEDSGGILMAEAQVGCPYHNGDKVKIIVIKED